MGLESKLRIKKSDSKSRPENDSLWGKCRAHSFVLRVRVSLEEGTGWKKSQRGWRRGGGGGPWGGPGTGCAVGRQFRSEPALRMEEAGSVPEEESQADAGRSETSELGEGPTRTPERGTKGTRDKEEHRQETEPGDTLRPC